MSDPFLTAALAALDAWLVEVCDREEARAQRLAQGGLTGWAGVKALARPAAAELAFDADPPPDLVPEGDQPLTAGREAFRLEPAETEALLVLLSLHLEPRYGALYGVLQGSTHAWATERLLLTVLGRRMDRRRALLESLSDAGRLLGAGLVVVVEGSSHAPLCRPLDLAPEVRSALLGIGLPSRLGAATLERLDGRDRGAPLGPAPAACSVVFGAGEWRPSVEALAGARRDLLLVGPVDDRAAVLSAGLAAWRLGALTGALPVVDLTGIDSAAAAAVASALRRRVEAYGGRIALRARDPLPLPVPHVEARVPPFSERRRVWRDEAARHGASLSEEEAGRLAATFRAGPAGVRDAFGAAVEVGAAGLREAAARLARVPVRHAQEVEVRRTFADLVVRDTTREALERLVHFATHKDRLDEERGLSTRFRMRRGPLVLFSGLSGTGKTLAAEAVAHALGRALHVVDLSRLVSKYIGETEKHISEVLSDAERAGVVLFFDEADALFSTRTEVSTSNDRYANLEVGFLLQRIEQHDGVTILATNLRQAIDEAFLRRFQFRVEFPLPEPAERRGIWDRMIPPGVPRAPGLDLEALGRAHRLAGGDIANAALRAIFLAERGGEPVENHHLERAVALELMELGRLSRRVPPRDDDPRDAGMLLKLFVEALSSLLEEHLRRRFIKEIHLVHGAPTKEALAGRRPAVSVALYRMSAPRAGGLRLGIIVSAWSHKAEEEHELLGAAHEALMGKLPGLLGGAKAVMRVQESNDFDLLHRFWSSHGHPVRASVVVEGEIG